MDFSCIMSENLVLQAKYENFHAFIDEIKATVKDMVEMKGLEFALEISKDLPKFFKTDYQRVQQIILNLVNNAIKFTIKGTVTLSIQTFSDEESSSFIRFLIRDTGMGMDSQKQKQIKQLLDKNDFELQNNKDINETGICLGLSISQILAKMLGPKENEYYSGISFNSEQNQGSDFIFYLENQQIDTIVSQLKFRNDSICSVEKNKIIQHISGSSLKKSKTYVNPTTFLFKKQKLSCLSIPKEYHQKSSDEVQSPGTEMKSSLQCSACFSPASSGKKKIILKKINKSLTFNNTIQSANSKLDEQEEQIDAEEMNTDDANPISEVRLNPKKKRSIICQINVLPMEKEMPAVIPTPQFTQIKKTLQSSSHLPPLKQVLIVDDDAFNLNTLELLLKKFNIECTKAPNGQEALNIVMKFKQFDLILMDYQMPIMNGIKATIAIQEFWRQNFLKGCTIIACSAFENVDIKEECFKAGMQAYLSKPLNYNKLEKVVREYLK